MLWFKPRAQIESWNHLACALSCVKFCATSILAMHVAHCNWCNSDKENFILFISVLPDRKLASSASPKDSSGYGQIRPHKESELQVSRGCVLLNILVCVVELAVSRSVTRQSCILTEDCESNTLAYFRVISITGLWAWLFSGRRLQIRLRSQSWLLRQPWNMQRCYSRGPQSRCLVTILKHLQCKRVDHN